MAFVDEPFVPKLLHDPPDGFHVVRLHGLVVVVEIHPAAQAGDDGPPLVHIAEHRSPAGFVELRDAIFFYIGFGVQPELFLNEIFHRKAVAVPAEAAIHLEAFHGFIAGNNILDGAGHEMPKVGKACGEGGAVVENEFWAALPMGY